MKKRILSLFLVVAMCLGMITVVYAEEPTVKLTITADKSSAKVGEVVTFTVTCTSTKKLYGLEAKLDIPSVFTYVENSGALADGVVEAIGGTSDSKYLEANKQIWLENTSTPMTITGTVTLATFQCTANAIGTATVSLTGVSGMDEDFNSFTYSVESASVMVVSEITGVDVDITAPVKGATPQATIAEGTGYTGTIAWDGSPSAFAGETVYSANVTLTAKTGYKFASDATATVAGSTSITGKTVADDGSTLSFKVTFPATAGKETPVVSVAPTASAITYGQTLADSALTGGTASVEGTFAWSDATIAPQVSDSGVTEYNVVFTPSDTANYTSTTCKVTLTVNPKVVTDPTFVGVTTSYEYTGSAIEPAFTLKDGVNEIPASEYNVAYSDNVNKGTATITITDKTGGNYTVSGSKTFEITAKAISDNVMAAITGYTGTYDGTAHNAVVIGAAAADYTVTYSTDGGATYSGTMPTVTNVSDSKTVTVKVTRANYADNTKDVTVTVNSRDISGAVITLNTIPTYSGSEQQVTISSVQAGGLTLNASDYDISVGTDKATNVESKTLTITGKGNYSGTATKTWSLQKATPVITVDASKSIVKGVTTDLGATIAPNTLTLTYVSADTSKVTVSADGKVTGVALTETPVNVTVSFAGNGNYHPASKTVAVTVTNKTSVTVTFADATSKTYTGSAFQLGAQFAAATVEGSKALTGYKYNGTTYETLEALKAVEVTDAGTYTVTAYYETETEYGEASASFTINKADQAALSITSANTMKYGEELTLTVSGGSGDGAVTYEVTNGTGSATLSDGKLTATGVGTVTVKATKAGSTNYKPATATLTVTIDKADQTITADNVSAAYGDTNAKVTATTSGNGTISYAVKSGSEDYIAVAADGTLTIKKVGTAYVTVTAGATDNYNSATKEVTVTIAPKAITAPAADTKTYTYNGKDQTYGVTGTADYTVSNGVQKNADSHTVTVALKDKENTVWADTKDAVDKTFSFVIKQATITITAKSKTAYVGDAVPELGESDYTVTGLAEGESLKTAPTITYISTPDMTKSGSVVIKVSDAEAPVGGNYEEIAYVNGTLTIITKSSGGSSGGGVSTYAITVETAKNGSVTSSHKTAAKGTTVTLTVAPDTGYELDTLTVTDGSGNKVSVTEKSGKYTFTMPASKVTVKAAFAAVVVEPENPFTDVPASAYYYDAVLWAADKGITGGTSTTTFSPNATCTRAQAVTFLWRAAGSPAPKSGTMPFTDVPAGSYYEQAVLWAVEQGITKGTSDTTFSPNAECTRAQIVTFLWRSQGSPAAGSVNPFTDVAADAYYASAVLWAVENGITAGTTATTFSPASNCTRAQIVTFLYRCLGE